MLAPLFLLFFCTLSMTDRIDYNSSTVARIPEVMSYLCPGVDICGIFGMHGVTGSDKVCCSACSCESDCETNGNCCYPSKLPYTPDNIDLTWLPQYKRECLYPTTLLLSNYQKLLYQPYYMITSVPTSLSCGDTKVAFWGSLFPVYSATRNQIYKNIVCATTDGVKDGVPWNVILACNFRSSHQIKDNLTFSEWDADINALTNLELSSNFEHWNCHVNFIVEGIRIDSLKCYTDVIDDCLDSGLIQVPNGINISAEDIIDTCSSKLVSPYRKEKMYVNVFCYMCNTEIYSQENECKIPSLAQSIRTGSSGRSFLGLIDSFYFLNEGTKGKSTTMPKITLACDINNKADCRQIHCPSGQLPDVFGNCKHSISKWYNQALLVVVNVTTDIYLNTTELIEKNTIAALTSPWPKDWIVLSVKQIDTRLYTRNTQLSIDLVLEARHARPVRIIKTVMNYVKQKWVLKDGKTSYIFKSDLPRRDYKMSSEMGRSLVDVIRIANRTQHINLPNISISFFNRSMFMEGYGIRVNQVITRLHYCKQIELNPSEFILSENKTALFNVRTQRLMFIHHTFELSIENEIPNLRVRICIEDSGFSEKSQASIFDENKILLVYIILTVIGIFVF